MKTLRKIGYLIIAVFVCFGMASCSDDDDDDSGNGNGNATVKVGSTTFSVPYAFWHFEGTSGATGKKVVNYEFYSFNPLKSFPSSISFVGISFDVNAGDNDVASVTVPAGSYEVYIAHGVSMNSEGMQYETIYNDYSENSDLQIVRSGNNFSIKIEKAKVGDDKGRYDFSFNYSGGVTNQKIADSDI